jgi:hypothetical protein
MGLSGWEYYPGGMRIRVDGTVLAVVTPSALSLEAGKTLTAPTIKQGGSDIAAGTQVSKISDPSGGGTVDTELRTAINAVIDALEAFGISAT